MEIHMVPKKLYYHEVAYVRGLEKRIEALEAALREIADLDDDNPYRMKKIARAALAPEQAQGSVKPFDKNDPRPIWEQK